MNKSSPLAQRGQSGFTLVELITVMLIIGIMAVVVLPRFDVLRGYDQIGYRDKVKATLEYARKSAVAQRRNVQVALAGSSLTLTIASGIPEGLAANTFDRSLNLPARDGACGGATNRICAPANIALGGPATLTFSPLGRPSALGTYTVTDTSPGGDTSTISVMAETGYVQ